MNLINFWKEKAKRETSLKVEVEGINKQCNLKLTSSHVIEMSKGQRKLDPCTNWIMLNQSIHDIFDKFDIKFMQNLSGEQWIELIDTLTAPQRIK